MRRRFCQICLLPCLLALSGCGPTLEEGADARIRVTPAQRITFSRVTTGESRALPFVITSAGKDDLHVRRIEWDGPGSVSLLATGSELPRSLASGGSMPVSVTFTPTVANPSPNGTVHIYTNDPERPIYSLDVTAQQLAPAIHVVPSAEEKLIFGQTDVGAIATESVFISNTGDLPLEVASISIVAPNSFTYKVQGTLPKTLAVGARETIQVDVRFAPTMSGKQDATLVIQSNDPEHPEYRLPIIANSDTPCMKIAPTIVEFASVTVDMSRTIPVKITSCSNVPLVVSEVIPASANSTITAVLKDPGKELRKDEYTTVDVTFSPKSEGGAIAYFTVLNNDPMQPNATLTAIGTGSTNQCPKAVAQARLSSSSNWAKSLDLAPLDTVILDGSLSSDKESKTLTYQWEIVNAPKDSTAKLATDGDKASFFLDLAGSYEFCLEVTDTEGAPSCNRDCVTVTATPRKTIHVQLVWNTPGDKTPGDSDGTDVDLHVMSFPGKWGDVGDSTKKNGTDVFFENPKPIWTAGENGTVLPISEEPTLDIDDKDGEGPENINLDKPNPCRWYAIGVHYFDERAFGPSWATVRVYVNGKMIFEKPKIQLPTDKFFKHVAWMFWTGEQAIFYGNDDIGVAYTGGEDEWRGIAPNPHETLVEAGSSRTIAMEAKEAAPHCFP